MSNSRVQVADGDPAAGPRSVEDAWPGQIGLLQRIIMPRQGDSQDVRVLYLEEHERNSTRAKAIDRGTLHLPPQLEVSFGTYFNAFPASYWRRWTSLATVYLCLRIDGNFRVDIYRSKADGTRIHVDGRECAAGDAGELIIPLNLAPFEDGGWYWFDITTEDGDDVVFHEGGWYSADPAPGRAAAVLGMPTFNRPSDCVGVLKAIAGDPLLMASVVQVVVVDQGTKKIVDHPEFAAAGAQLGDRLRLIDQPNLGGSGGYARIMHEALKTDAEQIVYMDDDIAVEPDSILRAIAFSRFAERPMLVGGQMLNLQERSHLHSMGEVVDWYGFMWRGAPGVVYDHDLADEPLRETPWLHRRIDVDYNGWWTCLIPRAVVEDIGLPLPFFLKWDDTEYGLRAARAGYPTASVPGIAVWHQPWSDKDDATDWQAYFHLRNRLVTAAMYGSAKPPYGLLKSLTKGTLKHLLSLQYSTVALQDLAVQDFVAGPAGLFDLLPTALGRAAKLRSGYDDAKVLPSAKALPLPSMGSVTAESFLRPPVGTVPIAKKLLGSVVHNLVAPKPEHHERPQLNIPAQDARWFLLSKLDGATVSTSDGTGISYRKRNPKDFWTLLRAAARNEVFLTRQWPRLSKLYRDAHRELSSRQAWAEFFARYDG